jgi:hypothetical protein
MALYIRSFGACASCDSLGPGSPGPGPGPQPPEPPGVPEGPGPSPGEPPPLECRERGFPWLWVALAGAVGYYWKGN